MSEEILIFGEEGELQKEEPQRTYNNSENAPLLFPKDDTFQRNLFNRKRNSVSIDLLQNNISEFNRRLAVIFANVKSFSEDYSLEEITINAELGLDGSIGFLGTGVSGSAKAGISFKLKKNTTKKA